MGYLEENDLSSAIMNEDGSWLKDLGKIVARLWIVGLTPPRFQMAVRSRCKFLSVEGDPAGVMEVAQQMVENINFSGSVSQWATGKRLTMLAAR